MFHGEYAQRRQEHLRLPRVTPRLHCPQIDGDEGARPRGGGGDREAAGDVGKRVTRQDEAKGVEMLTNYNEARRALSAIPAKVRKFAQVIVARGNHLSAGRRSHTRTIPMAEKIDLVPSPPDEFSELIMDVCIVIGRVILLAPPDQQRAMCVLVLREINDVVEQVLQVNETSPH